ncbi:cancer-related nucleoside-triphosphatase isoform X2 [Galleria mellonella]|uniref:Cancer-related nucleoside-triphosphatase isoform X2 n=1 Tax=Galleria mellonella TaxID=7137 RepID=A0ABM3N726_GALME|nr:cancer-related nucleoside-triphosphatase isoform X2 [Galleria mellonella]
MANKKLKYFILTGEPGAGKTTLTKKIISILSDKGIKTFGFYTEEVRRDRTREGFDVVTLEGKRGRLAREERLLEGSVKFRVGKYGVLVQEFEKVALPCLQEVDKEQLHLLVIDEIGKMEFFSNSFKARVREIFSESSNNIVLATIPLRKSDALIENIRNNKYAKIWTIEPPLPSPWVL